MWILGMTVSIKYLWIYKHAPLVKFSTNCPRKLKTNKRLWINVELFELMNERDYVYRQSPLNLKLKFKH